MLTSVTEIPPQEQNHQRRTEHAPTVPRSTSINSIPMVRLRGIRSVVRSLWARHTRWRECPPITNRKRSGYEPGLENVPMGWTGWETGCTTGFGIWCGHLWRLQVWASGDRKCKAAQERHRPYLDGKRAHQTGCNAAFQRFRVTRGS